MHQRGMLGVELSRRRLLWLIATVASAASFPGLLAACGGDDDDDDEEPTAPAPTATIAGPVATGTPGAGSAASPTPAQATATSAAAPTATLAEPTAAAATGGELRVAASRDALNREPESSTIGMALLNPNIYETLVLLTLEYEIEPLLAESWEIIEPYTIRFTLREGVTFHDGTPFTAEAVVWSMDLSVRGGNNSPGYSGVDEGSTKAVDDLTVDVTPVRPTLRLLQQMTAGWGFAILAPQTDSAEERIGTGPFKEVEYVPDDHHTVERYEDYWGEPAKLDKITFRFLPDPPTRVLALQAGEVDLAFDVPRETAAEVEDSDGLHVVVSGVGSGVYLLVNLHGQAPHDLLQEQAVREAVAAAIDKQAIVDDVWQGYAEPSATMIPPAVLGSSVDLVEGIPFDPERAKQLLEDAGWHEGSGGIRERDGRQLKLDYVVLNYEAFKPVPEFVQAQLKDVGIHAEIVKAPDSATYYQLTADAEGDLFMEQGSQNTGNLCSWPNDVIYSTSYGEAFAAGAEADTAIDACFAAPTLEGAQEALASALHLAVDEIISLIPLVGTPRVYGIADTVEGFVAHPSQLSQRWDQISIKAD